jgi:hypothetical protein
MNLLGYFLLAAVASNALSARPLPTDCTGALDGRWVGTWEASSTKNGGWCISCWVDAEVPADIEASSALLEANLLECTEQNSTHAVPFAVERSMEMDFNFYPCDNFIKAKGVFSNWAWYYGSFNERLYKYTIWSKTAFANGWRLLLENADDDRPKTRMSLHRLPVRR